jgi:hypothetical protein
MSSTSHKNYILDDKEILEEMFNQGPKNTSLKVDDLEFKAKWTENKKDYSYFIEEIELEYKGRKVEFLKNEQEIFLPNFFDMIEVPKENVREFFIEKGANVTVWYGHKLMAWK